MRFSSVAPRTIFDMMEEIVVEQPRARCPSPAHRSYFPDDSPRRADCRTSGSPRAIYDHIRMLDAEGISERFPRLRGLFGSNSATPGSRATE